MKTLIIGGTRFLGRALAEAALARGDTLTLFHRGKTNPELFPAAEHILGDRHESLDLLDGRTWDTVIDTCGYFPHEVETAAAKLKNAVGRYLFISSISVYSDMSEAGITETAPLGRLDPAAAAEMTEITGDNYGPLKVLCEQAAESALPGRVLIIRPGLIVGPHDPTDRFTYWPARLARGGEVLVPGRPDDPLQFIDVRDLAGWVIEMAARQAAGVYHATSPAGSFSMGALVETCRDVSGVKAQLHWVPDSFLVAREIGPWVELPLWMPHTEENRGFMQVDTSKAEGAGLTIRPLAETVGDTLAWHQERQGETMVNKLSPEREQGLLDDWLYQG